MEKKKNSFQQEMKKAYEQQCRKLLEFTDFVKRYISYLEKLMPTSSFA